MHRMAKRGLVIRVAPRVYRFAVGRAPDWKDRLAAELLSTGGTACGCTAPALFGLTDAPDEPDVLVPRGHRLASVHGRHTTRELLRGETAIVDGLRSLTPVRAILDAAHRMPHERAVEMIESAIVRGLVRPVALERRARELRHNKRPGCAVTLCILGDLHPELARSRNESEARVARRARELGLPEPVLEFEIVIDGRRYLADAAWPAARVLLEFDGRDPHMRRRVHDHDSGRRNDLVSASWRRFGITASALRSRDDRTFLQVARAIREAQSR
jgi:very-short-patch-repair endonuclease